VVVPAFPDRAREAAAAKKLDEQTVVVVPGDVLTTIAERSNTTVDRIFDANPHIENPNLIEVGEKVRIPEPDEALPDRMPEPPVAAVEAVEQPQPPAPVVYTAPTPAAPRAPPAPSYTASSGLVGQIGWANPCCNCVNTAKAYGKNQNGNPSSWIATTQTPFIGAAALFHYNHVGIVVGIWPNGDLEIAHENFQGGIHRFSRSNFRGFF
jgi:LysM repeat protein